MMSSVRKIAQLAGVSPSTVSRALRNDQRIREETRSRIQEMAQLYHYRPNRLVQSLMSGKSSSIGFLVPSLASTFFAPVTDGVLESAFEESFHVILLKTHSVLQHTVKALQTLIELQVDGIILATGHGGAIPSASILELWSHGIHLVAFGETPVSLPLDRVTTDEKQLAEIGINYLCELGHRHIGYTGGDPASPRAQGVQHALRRRGLETEFNYLCHTEEEISQLFDRLQGSSTCPTAFIAYNDIIAAQLSREAQHRGLRVPRDISILGCANVQPLVETVDPQITTLEQHPALLGRQALELLLRRINAQELPGAISPQTIAIPPTLVPRASCGPPRRALRWP
ncbi:MAG: LacI family DNA-binding transcriptional regulator [Armatimonadota bacterium]